MVESRRVKDALNLSVIDSRLIQPRAGERRANRHVGWSSCGLEAARGIRTTRHSGTSRLPSTDTWSAWPVLSALPAGVPMQSYWRAA